MRRTQLPREQLQALEKAFRKTRNPTEQLRYQVIRLTTKGFSRKQICEIVDKSPRCIGGWIATYHKEGLAGLKQKRQPGNHHLLTKAQKTTIKQLITTKTPDELSLEGRFWTISLLMQLVWQQFRLRYKDEDSYRRLFHWCGFTSHKPDQVNKRQSVTSRKEFEEKLKKDWRGIARQMGWYW